MYQVLLDVGDLVMNKPNNDPVFIHGNKGDSQIQRKCDFDSIDQESQQIQ